MSRIKSKYMAGETFGRLTFIREALPVGKQRFGVYNCSCGVETTKRIADVKNGDTKSCGCLHKEIMRARGKKRELIYCKCGCGETLIGMDSKGRNRKFIHGHNKGHNMPHSKETADKMRILRLGKKCSIEIRIKMSLSAKKGSENNNWKGGTTKEADKIRKSIEYKFWRESVFERDNYTCVECSEKESVSGKLNADHIKPFAYFPEMRFDINNGRTLCVECHKKTDTYLKKAQLKYPELHKLLKTA